MQRKSPCEIPRKYCECVSFPGYGATPIPQNTKQNTLCHYINAECHDIDLDKYATDSLWKKCKA